ncbi:asparaginase [Paenalcaligenes sp. Me52]|uniref:asparaginase n=1 Tax=Paenalcaligenes sp. Me52 TaxID=3392038 RepID=UPI003D2998D4
MTNVVPVTGPVLILYTGGTLGMELGANGWAPAVGFEQRIQQAQTTWPQAQSLPAWRYATIDPPIDSANMTQQLWLSMRDVIVQAAEQGCSGVVVLHGTDTLAYSAAALSFLLGGLGVPVVLTGSMRPAVQPDTDAWANVFGALSAITSCAAGVFVYFHQRLLRGTQVSKWHSEADDAFRAVRHDGAETITGHVPLALNFQVQRQPVSLAVVPFYPGFQANALQSIVDTGVQGLILECYGTGTGPTEDAELLAVLHRAIARGVAVVGISQCPVGSVLPGQYAAGSLLVQAGMLPSGSMTREAALAKLFALLGAGITAQKLPDYWLTDFCGELA